MAAKANRIAAGRNVSKKNIDQTRKPGDRKSNARDRLMKLGDLRHGVAKTRSRFSRKRPKAYEISMGHEPIELPNDPHTRASSMALRNKLTATVAALTPSRARLKSRRK